jgi:hypothetical protein
MGMLGNIGGHIGKAIDSTVSVPGDTAKAGVEMLFGEPAIPKIKETTKRAVWDVVALGPRIVKEVAVGLLKGTLKFTWNLIKLLPLPVPTLEGWKNERDTQTQKTHQELTNLRGQITPFDIKRGTEPLKTAA